LSDNKETVLNIESGFAEVSKNVVTVCLELINP